MNQDRQRLIVSAHLSAIAGLLAAGGDFVVTFILGALYPGYDFVQQSESYLGTADSPVANYMNVWGIIFCLLLMVFAYGLRKTIFSNGVWQTMVVCCVLLYGLGEGAGSGLFPYNHVNGALTLSGKLHSLFGGLAGAAIVFVPFACTKIFTKDGSPRMHAYSWFVFGSGLLLVIIFLISECDIILHKGLWQRLFILDYHLYLSVLAVVMLTNLQDPKLEPQRYEE
jgi:hypothetical protein